MAVLPLQHILGMEAKSLSASHRSRSNDPNRIKETLQQGKTYAVVLKAGLESQVEDKAWGFRKVVSLAYYAGK